MTGLANRVAPLRRWSVVPVAHPDEDPASIIVRLAGRHFLRPHDLFKLYFGRSSGLLSDVGTQPQILEQVDTIAGYGREFLLSLRWQRRAPKTVTFRDLSLPTNWIGEVRRVAPGVLANDGDDPYCRLSWRFVPLTVDVASGELLIERCPACLCTLTWAGIVSVHRCQSCNHDLRSCRPMFAGADTLASARRLASVLGFWEDRPIKFPHPFTTADMVDAMRTLEWGARFGGQMRLDRTAKSPANASRGIDVIENWPRDLELAADLVFRQNRTKHVEQYTLQAALEELPTKEMRQGAMEQLAHILKRPEFQKRESPALPRNLYFQA